MARSEDPLLSLLNDWDPGKEFRPALDQLKDELSKGLSDIPLADIRRKCDHYAKRKAALLTGHPQLEHLSSNSPVGRVEREFALCEAFIDAANVEIARRSRRVGTLPLQSEKGQARAITDRDLAKQRVDTEESKGQDAGHSNESFTCSEDYRTVAFHGELYTLTPRQAEMIQILDEARKSGMPDVAIDHVLEKLGTMNSRWQDMWKTNEKARKALIKSGGARKGTLRLNL